MNRPRCGEPGAPAPEAQRLYPPTWRALYAMSRWAIGTTLVVST
jgi:hypothetical protein